MSISMMNRRKWYLSKIKALNKGKRRNKRKRKKKRRMKRLSRLLSLPLSNNILT